MILPGTTKFFTFQKGVTSVTSCLIFTVIQIISKHTMAQGADRFYYLIDWLIGSLMG